VGHVSLTDVWGEYRAKHVSMVIDLAASPDGRHLASVSLDGVAMLWDSTAGEAVRVIRVEPRDLEHVAFSSDGALALVCVGSRLAAHDVETGRMRWIVEAHPEGADVTPLSKGRAFTTGGDGMLRVWDLERGELLRELRLASKAPRTALAADERLLVVASEGELSLWDLQRGRRLRRLGAYGSLRGLAVTPDGRRALTLDRGSIHVFDVGLGRELSSWKASGERDGDLTRGLACTSDGQRAISGASSGELRVWDIERGELVREVETGHTSWIEAIVITPAGAVLTAGNDQQLRLFEPDDWKPLWPEQRGHSSAVTALTTLPDGAVASGGVDGRLLLWRRGRASRENGLDAPSRAWINDVAFVEGALVFAAGKAVCTWQIDTGKVGMRVLPSRVHSIVRAPEGFYAVTDAGVVGAWKLTDRGPTLMHRLAMKELATRRAVGSPGGELLALLGKGVGFSIYSLPPGERARGRTIKPTMHSRKVLALSFVAGRLLLGREDGRVRLFDDHQRRSRDVGNHRGPVFAVAGDASGELAVTAGPDGVRVWDLEEQAELAWLRLGRSLDRPSALAVEPGGSAFLVGTRRGVVLRFAVER
jgi:WD40 repeat protein